MTGSPGRVVSVNVGVPRPVRWRGRIVHTAIFKYPMDGRVPVRGVNLLGDDQADREVHGGPDKAVYAYAREDLDWWAGELGRRLRPGVFGDHARAPEILAAPELAEFWRGWAQGLLDRKLRRPGARPGRP